MNHLCFVHFEGHNCHPITATLKNSIVARFIITIIESPFQYLRLVLPEYN